MKTLHLSDVTAIIDTREQTPFDLEPMNVIAETLAVGDYSVAGLESVVAIERKSLPDFVQCCGRERERFQRELDRLRGWPVSAVVLEFNWQSLEQANWRGKLTAGQVQASFAAWIAQGHRLILGHDPKTAARITRGILFYTARYRFREASALLQQTSEAASKRESARQSQNPPS